MKLRIVSLVIVTLLAAAIAPAACCPADVEAPPSRPPLGTPCTADEECIDPDDQCHLSACSVISLDAGIVDRRCVHGELVLSPCGVFGQGHCWMGECCVGVVQSTFLGGLCLDACLGDQVPVGGVCFPPDNN